MAIPRNLPPIRVQQEIAILERTQQGLIGLTAVFCAAVHYYSESYQDSLSTTAAKWIMAGSSATCFVCVKMVAERIHALGHRYIRNN